MKSVARVVAVGEGAILLCAVAGQALLGCQSDQPSSGDGVQTVNARGVTTQVVVECDVNLGLTPESGVRVDWNDEARAWVVDEDGDRVTLRRTGMCGDECGFVEEIVFENTGPCPAFVSARVAQFDAMDALEPDETRAAQGTVQLQDWDTQGGVISGRIDAEVEFTFYARFEQ